MRTEQLELFKKGERAYGGVLLKTRRGRRAGRPLATRHSMHLVLRSSQARGGWSLLLPKNKVAVSKIVTKFSKKYGVRIHSLANVGNHLHFHIQLTNRLAYRPFIRAVTCAIAMAVTGWSRWRKRDPSVSRFWDLRPFTRVILSFRQFLGVKDYLKINRLEGSGWPRDVARLIHRDWAVDTG